MQWVDLKKEKKLIIKKNQVVEYWFNIFDHANFEIELAENAVLRIYQTQSTKINLILRGILKKNAHLQYYSFSKYPKKEKIHVVLAGENSKLEFNDYVLGALESDIFICHRAKNTTSSVKTHGIIKNSKVFVTEKLHISENATNSDAFLSSRFIADKRTNAIIQPHLEILNKNVKAGHEAAITKLDEDEIFYLTSRGLSKQKAKKILLDTFIAVPPQLR